MGNLGGRGKRQSEAPESRSRSRSARIGEVSDNGDSPETCFGSLPAGDRLVVKLCKVLHDADFHLGFVVIERQRLATQSYDGGDSGILETASQDG